MGVDTPDDFTLWICHRDRADLKVALNILNVVLFNLNFMEEMQVYGLTLCYVGILIQSKARGKDDCG